MNSKSVISKFSVFTCIAMSLALSGCFGDVSLSKLSDGQRQQVAGELARALPQTLQYEVSEEAVPMYSSYPFHKAPKAELTAVSLKFAGSNGRKLQFAMGLQGRDEKTGSTLLDKGVALLSTVHFGKDCVLESANFDVKSGPGNHYSINANDLTVFADGEIQLAHVGPRSGRRYEKIAPGPRAAQMAQSAFAELQAKIVAAGLCAN